MSDDDRARALWMAVMDYTRPEQMEGDDARCTALLATALREARAAGLEEAARKGEAIVEWLGPHETPERDALRMVIRWCRARSQDLEPPTLALKRRT